ncbi:hypothetical protein GIB67_036730 [Kingdonia uniflora]|uniref:RNase H type-1 domain-containing protein n=1 Tax=Kingdonia uniflora TaxID=39325 RepID=A0A7J7LWH2_9MAGN|nr:hypothetical protein GIB67_036730 [Kingdonia uniflora]
MNVPFRIQFFVWKALQDGIPINHKLRFVDHNREAPCPRCLEEVETTTHALFFCKKVRATWAKSFIFNLSPLNQLTTRQYIHPLSIVEEGWHIVLVDEAWSNSDSQGGSSFVIKIYNLSVIGAGHASTRAEDAEEAEAISVIRGMRAARSVGLEKVVVLTDCRRLVRAYELGSDDLSWGALTLAPDMLGLASCFSDFRFCHISRSLNFEAHALAARGPLFPAVSIFEPLEASLFVNDVTCSL